MGGGSPSQPTQTTKYELSPEQRQLMDLAMPGVRDFAASTPQRYKGTQVAGFTPEQTQGQDMALASAAPQAELAANAAKANNFYTSGSVWDPASNPNLQGAIDASVRPITQQLTESQLPAIRGEAVTTGNFGGSRQGIAEGLASRGASQAIGDTASKLVQNQYQTNVDAQLKAMGLLPTVQGAQTAAATTTSGVGDVRQAMDQARINENVNAYNYDQMAPFLQSKEIMSLLQGLPGGSTTSTGNNPTTNPLMSSLGGAAAGASLGTALMPGIGTGIGALGGAVLPFLMNR
jgi:hypothetical protein